MFVSAVEEKKIMDIIGKPQNQTSTDFNGRDTKIVKLLMVSLKL